MSYNLGRRVFRSQCKGMIAEFKTEANLTSKQLDNVLTYHEKRPISGLKDRFNRMIKLALGKYKLDEPEAVVENIEPTQVEV